MLLRVECAKAGPHSPSHGAGADGDHEAAGHDHPAPTAILWQHVHGSLFPCLLGHGGSPLISLSLSLVPHRAPTPLWSPSLALQSSFSALVWPRQCREWKYRQRLTVSDFPASREHRGWWQK